MFSLKNSNKKPDFFVLSTFTHTMPCKFLITTLEMGSYRERLQINHIPLADVSCIPKNDTAVQERREIRAN